MSKRGNAGTIPKTYNERALEAQRKPRKKTPPGEAVLMKPGDDHFSEKPERPRPFKQRGT